jgi:hypothetical protein
MAQTRENMFPKTARADGPKSAGQQIYGCRDVAVSYASDFDAGQRLPLNCQINRVANVGTRIRYARRGSHCDFNCRIRELRRERINISCHHHRRDDS